MLYAARLAILNFSNIQAGDFGQRKLGILRQIGHIPQHITNFLGQSQTTFSRKLAAIIADHFLDMLDHFAGFARQTEGRVNHFQIGGVNRAGGCGFLVLFKGHVLSLSTNCTSLAPMEQKTTPHQASRVAVVSGATSGIGFELVRGLAESGYKVIGIGRSPVRGRRMTEILRAQTGNPSIYFHAADLSLTQEARAVGQLLASQYPQIDLLFNNAGSIFQERAETAEGVERTLALNHLGPVVLTTALLPALEAAPEARIITVSSVAHLGCTLDLEDLGARQGRYRGWRQYQRSKLMNILFTRELARRLPETVTTAAVHPGFVATRFGSDNSALWRFLMRFLMNMAIKPRVAARGIMRAALDPELKRINGGYFDRGQVARPSAVAENDDLARQLWHKTEALIETLTSTPKAG